MINKNIHISALKEGINSSIENAMELISDAELLFENERYARCYCLCQLAIEEAGKAFLIYNFYNSLQLDKRNEFDFNDFNKKFRNHKLKTQEANTIEFIMYAEKKDEDIKNFTQRVIKDIQKINNGHYDKLKNDSLYTSFENKIFIKPSQTFNNEITLSFFCSSKKKVNFAKGWLEKHIKMDEWLGADKEGIIIQLKKHVDKK